jgi:hypothetical protein
MKGLLHTRPNPTARSGPVLAALILMTASSLLLPPGVLTARNSRQGIAPTTTASLLDRQARQEAGFNDFLARVDAYVKLHKSVASTLPALKPTPEPELIAAHQQALARKIREARPHAKRGDVFSDQARDAFRYVVGEEFRGPHGHRARRTIQQGEPLSNVHLQVNQPYPDGVPYTTLPPTLLLKFPKLPDVVAYRVVGADLLLLDAEANLVVDRIPGIIPVTANADKSNP